MLQALNQNHHPEHLAEHAIRHTNVPAKPQNALPSEHAEQSRGQRSVTAHLGRPGGANGQPEVKPPPHALPSFNSARFLDRTNIHHHTASSMNPDPGGNNHYNRATSNNYVYDSNIDKKQKIG